MKKSFRSELTDLLNRYSKENGSDTPDYVLAHFVEKAIEAFNHGVNLRSEFYGCGHNLSTQLYQLDENGITKIV